MAIIDLCAQGGTTGNTGQIKCDPKRANFQAILVGGASFTPSQYSTSAAFKTALLAALKKGTGDSGKLYPFPEVTTVTENTSENRTATLGNGTQIPLGEGRPSYNLGQYIGVNLEKQLRKFNNQTVPVFVFDDAGNVWGRIDANKNFVGIDANLFTKGAGFGDFASAKEVVTSVSFQNAKDFFDYSAFVTTDFAVSDLEGLLDATLSKYAASSSNTHKIAAKVINTQLGGDVNLYSTYKTLLNATGMWVGYSAAGAAITPTTVSFDDVNSGWTITFPSAVVSVNLANPTVLDAAGVVGIEGVLLSVV